MNIVYISGRAVRAVDMRYMQNGTAIARVSMAIDKKLSKDKREEMESQGKPTADFINIVAFSHTAEFMGNWLRQGKRFGVNGRLQSGKYNDKDGKTIYTTDVVANEIEIIDWPDDNAGGNNQSNNNDFGGIEGFHPTDNSDIPF